MPWLVAAHPVRYEPTEHASRLAQALVTQLSESPPGEVKKRSGTAVHGVQMPWLAAAHPVRYEPTSHAARSVQALVSQLSKSPPAEVK